MKGVGNMTMEYYVHVLIVRATSCFKLLVLFIDIDEWSSYRILLFLSVNTFVAGPSYSFL